MRPSEPSGLATLQHPFVKMRNVDSTADMHSELTGTAAVAERISAALEPFAELAGRPTVELRALGADEEVAARDLLGASVFQAVNTVELLGNLDPAEFDAAALVQWADGIEQVRRMAEAAAVAVAEHVDRTAPFRDQGFFSARTWLRHRLQLSGAEALGRVQTARMHRKLPGWAEAEQVGGVGVAQSELMARVSANPRINGDLLIRDSDALLIDAMELSYDEFEGRVRTWEALADPDGDRVRHERQRANRQLTLRPRKQGGWRLSGAFDELAGSQLNEVLAYFTEAEYRTDRAEAKHRRGGDPDIGDLGRTAKQRRADALLAMAAAAAGSSDAARSRSTLNILMDSATHDAAVSGRTIDPRRYRDVVCRTQRGRRLHTDDAVNAALVGHIRRVVVDSAGVVIDLGRRSRLFRGAAREAVMLLATQCVWIGCDRPVEWCDADHSVGWAAHGATVPRNGEPLCRGHNLLKERGYGVRRDAVGGWHFTHPDGTAIT